MTDEELAMAYADGELDAVTARRFERRMVEEPDLARAVGAQRALRQRLGDVFAPVAGEPVPPRLTAMLQSNVVPFASRRQRLWRQAAALAASLLIGVAAGHFLLTDDVTLSNGGLMASGSLAKSLETRLAGGDDATRMLLSFRDRSGAWCRVFESTGVDGIACRGADGWRLRQTQAASASAPGEYRQAASGQAQLMAAAQEMMAGDPLDAEAERKARDAGWR